ncbi:ficolin-3-like [Patiria miniata]|uniref:Fibrinogen C-terminal domain-containing protein n=1 Tax=Patiria miniata TaxID=46514 RepID=A0A913ZQG3_PATMI|nr:ficolin-3-like [Patiria miniata]
MAAVMLVVTAHNCLNPSPGKCTRDFHGATNRTLKNHAYQTKITASVVICGRDCSMDPRCASFNFNSCRRVCELNAATRIQRPVGDFIELHGSVYFDEDLETPLTSAVGPARYGSCKELLEACHTENGIYTIFPTGTSGTGEIQVYCDMETDGGGWIVFQRRRDGTVDFYRTWTEYRSGFGELDGEFWLGNEHLRGLTQSGQWRLRVDLGDWDGTETWAEYGEFAVSGDSFTLRVGGYDPRSTTGDSMGVHNGLDFITKEGGNCALQYEGAWWFAWCLDSHLNGKYYDQATYNLGIMWSIRKRYYQNNYQYYTEFNSLKSCSMKMREVL